MLTLLGENCILKKGDSFKLTAAIKEDPIYSKGWVKHDFDWEDFTLNVNLCNKCQDRYLYIY